jgi:hypothetical protein
MTDFEITIYDYVKYDKPEELASYELDISEEASKLLGGQDIGFIEKLEELGVQSHIDVICAIVVKKIANIMENEVTVDNRDYLAEQISHIAVNSVEGNSYSPFSFAFGEEKYLELEIVKHTDFAF